MFPFFPPIGSWEWINEWFKSQTSERQTWSLSFHHSSIWSCPVHQCCFLSCSEPAYCQAHLHCHCSGCSPFLPGFFQQHPGGLLVSSLEPSAVCSPLDNRKTCLKTPCGHKPSDSLVLGDGATWVWMLEWDRALEMISASYWLWLRTNQITKPLWSIYFSLKQGWYSNQ